MHNGLHVINLEKSFAGVAALANLSLDARPGEVIAITGPSGAGKTTTCRMIAGLEKPDDGAIKLGGRSIDKLAPQARQIAMMFESYALYPQMSVEENVAFPLRAPTREPAYTQAEIARRLNDVFELCELSALRQRKPYELSGGQKQRVALCRALVQEAALYVFDEPISHLDAKLRHKLRGLLRHRLTNLETPAIWCTPDGVEALCVADRVAVLFNGQLKQFDTPDVIFNRPADIQVARLVGDPAMNLLPGRIVTRNNKTIFINGVVELPLPVKTRSRLERTKRLSEIVLGVRATDIELAGNKQAAVGQAEVYTLEPFGKYSILTAKLGADMIKAKIFSHPNLSSGAKVPISFKVQDFAIFNASTGQAI
jgi:multiple sugar transport system ATP-binding protein